MWAAAFKARQEAVGRREGEHRPETRGSPRAGARRCETLSGQRLQAGHPSPASLPLAGRWALAGTGLVLAHGAGSRERVLKQGPGGGTHRGLAPFFRVAGLSAAGEGPHWKKLQDTWWPVLPHLGGREARAVPGALWAVCRAAGCAQDPWSRLLIFHAAQRSCQ